MNPSDTPRPPGPRLPFPEPASVSNADCNNGPTRIGAPGDYWNYCPNCGSRLHNERCKLRCPAPACGYFMSCSDFD